MSNQSVLGNEFITNLGYNDNPGNYQFGLAQSLVGQADPPGTVRVDYDSVFGVREFKFLLLDNVTSANVVSGDIVCMPNANGTGGSVTSRTVPPIFSATTAQASAAGGGASGNWVQGVAIANQTIGNYGWFQTKGNHPGVNSNVSLVIGNNFILSNTDKKATAQTGNSAVIGVAIANTASNLTPAILNVPFPGF